MNKRIYEILKNEINTYESYIDNGNQSNGAIFTIFDNFFHEISSNNEIVKRSGVKLNNVIFRGLMVNHFDIENHSSDEHGISFLITFDKIIYSIRFKCWRDGDKKIHSISIKNNDDVKYSFDFIYKYLLYNALETSKLKGSYFTMSRDSFDWDIKTIEKRSFDDIFLPDELMEDLHLFVDIFKESDKILRYLKVGCPGAGKTEGSLVIANELNKLGVTIIKTPICEYFHQKMELANVLAPALIILDDIDLSLGSRNSGAYSRLLGDFLDVLDGTDKLANNVGIIATTNATHLLDLAAQRPGRFDKTLLFDSINKDNIKNIILKSLKYNFNIESGKEIDLYTNKNIIDKFFDSGVSGSHVYNSIKMLKLRYDTLKTKDITSSMIVKNIESELLVISKIRKTSFLTEKYDRGRASVGFNNSSDEEIDNKVLSEEEPKELGNAPRKNNYR